MPHSKNKVVEFSDEDAVLAEMARELDLDPDDLSIKDETPKRVRVLEGQLMSRRRKPSIATLDEATGLAFTVAASHGETVNLDVLVWSEEGAEWYGGESAVEQYQEDPEASVFERFEVRVNPVGRVP